MRKMCLNVHRFTAKIVNPGLVPGIHVLKVARRKDVGGRDKPGYDKNKSCTGGTMPNSQPQGVWGPFAGLDVPWLLRMRADPRRDHPFLIWAPFDAPARKWSYGEFHDRVGALAAGLVARGIKPGHYVLIHLDNCIEAVLAWFACVELGAIAVTTNTRSAAAEMDYFAGHCGAAAAITQPAYAELISANCRGLRWIAVTQHDAGASPAHAAPRGDSFE